MNTNDVLFALADETRREIVARLAAGPRPAGHLAQGLPMSQPAVSKHLRVLRGAGLVESTKAGRQQVYQLTPEGLSDLQRILVELGGLWATALNRFKGFVEATNNQSPGDADGEPNVSRASGQGHGQGAD